MFITYLTSSSSEVSPHTTQKKKKVFNKEKGGHSHTLHIWGWLCQSDGKWTIQTFLEQRDYQKLEDKKFKK